MKHGDKAKAKSAKASRTPSDKKVSRKVASAKSAGKPVQAKGGQKSRPPEVKASRKESAAKGAAGDDNGRTGRTAATADSGGFANPVIAAALKRAIKKYPNAFRRLTD